MPNEETTTKFKVDISELKKEMQEAKRSAQLAHSEFKVAASECDNWQQSSNALSAKLKALNGALNEQKTKLALLEAEYNNLTDEQKQGSAAADRLLKSINDQKAAINSTEREISNYGNKLAQVSKAEKIAAATGKEVSVVLGDIKDSIDDASEGFTVFKGVIANFAGNILTGLKDTIKQGISNIANLSNETREYRNEMAKLDTAFTTNGKSADSAKAAYSELYGVIGETDQSVEAAQQISLLANSEKAVAEWAGLAAGVVSKFGDALQPETFYESANETIKLGEATGAYTQMLEGCGYNVDKFNAGLAACKTEEEKQAYMLEVTNGLLGSASDAYKKTNADIIASNKANSDYQSTLATLGEKAEPITTKIKEGFNGILQKILELVGDVDMTAFTDKIEEGFNVLTNDVLPAIKDGFQWILDNKDLLIAGLAGIAGGFVAFNVANTIMSVVNAFKAFKAANEGATIAQWLLNAAMNANPIMIIVTVIAAVISAIVAFIATNDDARAKFTEIWQSVCDFFKNVWNGIVSFFTETIPNAFKSVIDWVKENFDLLLTFLINPFAGLFKYFYENNTKFKEFVDNAIKFIKELPSKIWTWLQNTMSKVGEWIKNMLSKAKEVGTKFVTNVVNFFKELPSKIWTWLVNVVSKVAEWGGNLASKGKEAALKLFNSIVDKIKELPGKMLTIGKDLVKGIWNGISNAFDWLTGKIKEFTKGVTDKLKSFFGIHSPSRVMRDEIGKQLVAGIIAGIDAEKDNAEKSAEELAKLYVEAAKDKVTALKEANEIAELEEVYFWEEMQAHCTEGTEAYTTAVEEVKNAKKALNDAISSRQSDILGDMNLFEAVEVNEAIYAKDLIGNLETQVDALKEYDSVLDMLGRREGVVESGLYDELLKLGVGDLGKLTSINAMNDLQLEEFIRLFSEKKHLAEERAKKEFGVIEDASTSELLEMANTLKSEAENVGASIIEGIKNGIASKTASLETELQTLRNSLSGLIGADSISALSGSLGGLNASLATSSSVGGGNSVVNNYTQVINSPTAPNRLDLYRNTKNLLNYKGGK